jgi:uncharacterized protein
MATATGPKLDVEYPIDSICRVLALDGGGAKGFYTLGVLKEIEGMLRCPLHKRFDLIFGTSTGAIIAALLALGRTVDEIHELYTKYVPVIVAKKTRRTRSAALATLASEVFKSSRFEDVKTCLGIVATNWISEKPMIFKAFVEQAHGRMGTFIPGFGVSIAEAVQASCSAFPFFERKTLRTSTGDDVELIDGGYCANNPTLYAIADATASLKHLRQAIRVVNVGVGVYPEPTRGPMAWLTQQLVSVQLLQKTLEINTRSMDQLRELLFRDVLTIRISDTFEQPEMATDLLEHDLRKLSILRQRGRESFASRETQLQAFLLKS